MLCSARDEFCDFFRHYAFKEQISSRRSMRPSIVKIRGRLKYFASGRLKQMGRLSLSQLSSLTVV